MPMTAFHLTWQPNVSFEHNPFSPHTVSYDIWFQSAWCFEGEDDTMNVQVLCLGLQLQREGGFKNVVVCVSI